jgi:hypothetical protein
VAAPGLSGLMRDLRNFSFGVSCQKGFRADVAMDTASALAANRILARSQTSPYVDVEKPTPTAIRISVVVPQSEITSELMQKLARILNGGATALRKFRCRRNRNQAGRASFIVAPQKEYPRLSEYASSSTARARSTRAPG